MRSRQENVGGAAGASVGGLFGKLKNLFNGEEDEDDFGGPTAFRSPPSGGPPSRQQMYGQPNTVSMAPVPPPGGSFQRPIDQSQGVHPQQTNYDRSMPYPQNNAAQYGNLPPQSPKGFPATADAMVSGGVPPRQPNDFYPNPVEQQQQQGQPPFQSLYQNLENPFTNENRESPQLDNQAAENLEESLVDSDPQVFEYEGSIVFVLKPAELQR